MTKYEVVVREKPRRIVYIRKSPPRKFDEVSEAKKRFLSIFSILSHRLRGYPFEERIRIIQEFFEKYYQPMRTEKIKTRVFAITEEQYVELTKKLWNSGVLKRLEEVLPKGYILIVVGKQYTVVFANGKKVKETPTSQLLGRIRQTKHMGVKRRTSKQVIRR